MPKRNRIILICAFIVCMVCYVQARKLRFAGEIGYAMELINDHYFDDTQPEKLFRSAMQGMVKNLDPYSEFITAERYTQLERMMQQEFGGLGIIVEGPPQVKRLTIVTPLMGTPAYQAGLEPGDVIVSIDSQSTEDQTMDASMERLKGLEGTTVRLEIERAGVDHPLEFTVRRATIEVESVVGDMRRRDLKWEYMIDTAPDIAYVRITIFGDKTVKELEDALKQLDPNTKGLIIDLRDNNGGLLNAATKICDMFLEDGEIVSTRGRDGFRDFVYTAHPGVKLSNDIPIVVLVNDESASASEVVAACLQDRGRAVVAGQRSFGKGSVQNLIELSNIGGSRSALKITTARYYPPSGRNIHRGVDAKPEDEWGVHPDKGLELIVDDQQRKELFHRWRRRGDPRPDNLADKTTQPSADTNTEPLTDPVLERAIDYLHARQSPINSQGEAGK